MIHPSKAIRGSISAFSGRGPVKALYAISADIPVLRSGRAGTHIHIDGDNSPQGECRLWVIDNKKLYVSAASDFFDALIIMRTILEDRDIQVLCNGSRENVWPSETSRKMESGLVAYVCNPGKFATKRVYIFESIEDEHCVTVSEQKAYIEHWLKTRSPT